jgi:hypothetical protein
MKLKIGDWVVPEGSKVITQIEEIEHYPNASVAYTTDRKAYNVDQLMNIHQAYELEMANK